PLSAHWPGVVKAGSNCSQLVGLCDLMATFADVADTEIDPHQGPDSISFAKLLRQPTAAGGRQNLVMQSTVAFAVRAGDWKLCLCPGSGSHLEFGNKPRSDDAWRAALKELGRAPSWEDFNRAPFVQLFNVATDIGEKHNLAKEHPERVAEIIALFKKQIQNGRSSPGPVVDATKGTNVNRSVPKFVRSQIKE
ncbi:MAG: arylsulfatase A, partial [Pirellulaceae bacterium]